MKKYINFKCFFEEEEKKADFLSTLGDEEGIEWEDLVKALEAEPWLTSHFKLGKPGILYKLSPWEIVKGTLTPNGADIRLKPQHGSRSYLPGNRPYKSKYKDNKRYHLGREELMKFLTTGWTPAIQSQPSDMDASSIPVT